MSWRSALVVVGTAGAALLFSAGTASAQDMSKRGASLWQNRGCAACHSIGKKQAGPDLAGLAQRRSKPWLIAWLRNTDSMLGADSIAQAMLAEWKGIKMPTQKMSEQDAEAILAFIAATEAKTKKK